jgi:hypothetical protein
MARFLTKKHRAPVVCRQKHKGAFGLEPMLTNTDARAVCPRRRAYLVQRTDSTNQTLENLPVAGRPLAGRACAAKHKGPSNRRLLMNVIGNSSTDCGA